MTGAARGDIDRYDFTIAIRRDVDNVVALDRHPERERSANASIGTLIVREERTQVMFKEHRARGGVDHADGVVIVVGNDQSLAISRDSQAAGIGLNADAHALAGVSQGNRSRE